MVLDNNAEIVQGHGGICSPEKLHDDIGYIENVRELVRGYLKSGKTAKDAAAGITLADCIGEKRIANLPELNKEIHRENVEHICAELVEKVT